MQVGWLALSGALMLAGCVLPDEFEATEGVDDDTLPGDTTVSGDTDDTVDPGDTTEVTDTDDPGDTTDPGDTEPPDDMVTSCPPPPAGRESCHMAMPPMRCTDTRVERCEPLMPGDACGLWTLELDCMNDADNGEVVLGKCSPPPPPMMGEEPPMAVDFCVEDCEAHEDNGEVLCDNSAGGTCAYDAATNSEILTSCVQVGPESSACFIESEMNCSAARAFCELDASGDARCLQPRVGMGTTRPSNVDNDLAMHELVATPGGPTDVVGVAIQNGRIAFTKIDSALTLDWQGDQSFVDFADPRPRPVWYGGSVLVPSPTATAQYNPVDGNVAVDLPAMLGVTTFKHEATEYLLFTRYVADAAGSEDEIEFVVARVDSGCGATLATLPQGTLCELTSETLHRADPLVETTVQIHVLDTLAPVVEGTKVRIPVMLVAPHSSNASSRRLSVPTLDIQNGVVIDIATTWGCPDLAEGSTTWIDVLPSQGLPGNAPLEPLLMVGTANGKTHVHTLNWDAAAPMLTCEFTYTTSQLLSDVAPFMLGGRDLRLATSTQTGHSISQLLWEAPALIETVFGVAAENDTLVRPTAFPVSRLEIVDKSADTADIYLLNTSDRQILHYPMTVSPPVP